jgi:hypothetical protein
METDGMSHNLTRCNTLVLKAVAFFLRIIFKTTLDLKSPINTPLKLRSMRERQNAVAIHVRAVNYIQAPGDHKARPCRQQGH